MIEISFSSSRQLVQGTRDGKCGTQTISCAAGFGTCCLFRESCYGRVTEKVSYFSNPGWPLTNTSQSFCTFSVVVEDPDICQIRLDFETFELPPPSLTHSPIGECDSDRLAIFNAQQNLGLYQGNTVCGNLTGQHIYVPVDATTAHDPVRIFAFVGSNGDSYRWNIKSTMIDCSKESELRAPDGCLQYFTEPNGEIESLNYGSGAGSPYLAGTQYHVCIRRQTGTCGVKLESEVGNFVMNSNLANNNVLPGDGSMCLSAATNSSNDYISALGASSILGTSARVTDAFYCGGSNTSTFNAVTVMGGPFVFLVHTDDGVRYSTGELVEPATSINNTSLQQDIINQRERGFRLQYTLQPCGFNFSP